MARARAPGLPPSCCATVASPAARAASDDDARVNAALIAALPADGATDLVVIAQPSAPDAPRAWSATRVAASPAAIKDVLLDPAHYRALIPALIKSELERSNGSAPIVDWELEVPLFNLSGRMALHNRPDGVTIELFEGDFAPGRLSFTVAPDARGGATLVVDAVLDVKRSSWLLRRIIKRSPVGEPAALTAAAYVALRAVALRAEHPQGSRRLAPARSGGGTRELAARSASARKRSPGAAARAWRGRPGRARAGRASGRRRRGRGAECARAGRRSAPSRIPGRGCAFPGLAKVRSPPRSERPGRRRRGRSSARRLRRDLDRRSRAPPRAGSPPRAPRAAPASGGTSIRGASTIAALTLYPRIEATGSIARRFIAAEPLLEEGLSLALAFVDAAGIESSAAHTAADPVDLENSRGISRCSMASAEAAQPLVAAKSGAIMGMSLAALESHATRRLVGRMSPGALLHAQQ